MPHNTWTSCCSQTQQEPLSSITLHHCSLLRAEAALYSPLYTTIFLSVSYILISCRLSGGRSFTILSQINTDRFSVVLHETNEHQYVFKRLCCDRNVTEKQSHTWRHQQSTAHPDPDFYGQKVSWWPPRTQHLLTMCAYVVLVHVLMLS